MDSARDRHTQEIVDAEELLALEHVDQEGYICRGCAARVIPSAYRPENKVRPYFKVHDEHEEDCDVEAEPKLIAKGKKQRLRTRDGFPGSYPDRLILRDYRNVVGLEDGANLPVGGPHGWPSGGGGAPSIKNRPRSAGTIRPICRTFIHYPHDRDLQLHVPGIEQKIYMTVFKKLKWEPIEVFSGKRIFYAPIQWGRPEENEHYLQITLSAGAAADNRLKQPYRVRIEWAGWGPGRRTAVNSELDIAREESIKETKAGHKEKKGYVFFIGDQDAADPTLFHVHDHRLICALVDEIRYPPRK